MVDALLNTVIDSIKSLAQDQLATFLGVHQHTRKLTGHLTAIHAVLQDAEEMRMTSHGHAVKVWLQKLTDAAHVLDDILDHCSIQSNRQNSHTTCLTPFHPNNVLFRWHVGKRMKDITQRFHDIDEERRLFEFRAGRVVGTQSQPQVEEWRQTSSAFTEPKLYGRDKDAEQIVEFLLSHTTNNTEGLSIYPIVGLGGLGKTTLVQQVFNDERVTTHFDLKIWVCISDDFSINRIMLSIIESITGKNPNLLTLEALQKEVRELLQSKRYLLVLDDVWNEDQDKWNKLKEYMLQCARGAKGASILVTTRLENVANIVRTVSVHYLSSLSEDDNWSLFQHHAFGPDKEGPAELVSIGKEIAKKCAGLPLAAKALGGLLHFKSQKSQWLSVKEKIPHDNIIMAVLQLSYFNLKLSLRRCFSFCAIFPKDKKISKEDLIHLWMANGFISSRGSLEVEDVGYEAWNELYQRSFFQDVQIDAFSQITSFKMHDLVHDLAQSIMGEECVVCEPAMLTKLSSRVHHISCLKSDDDKHPRFKLNMGAFKKFESLRTFLQSKYPSSPNAWVLPSVHSLRALSTSSSQLSALKNLIHLRYLNIHRSAISTLPNSICELQKLQILKLKNCRKLSCLSKDLTRLQELRHLVIEGCDSLVAMPPNMGKLSCLRTLSTFIVGSKVGFGLDELHGLQLGGELHIRGLENVSNEWDAKEAILIDKNDLNHLSLQWGSNNANSEGTINAEHERVLEALQPPSNLKSFKMRAYMGAQLPSWMRNTSFLEGLVDVTLFDCNNCQRLPPFGKFPHLKSLYLYGMKDLKYIDDDSYNVVEEKAFPSLNILSLSNLPNVESLMRDEGVEMFPRLSKLRISEVPNLKLPCIPSVESLYYGSLADATSFPEGILRNLRSLNTLRIKGLYKLKALPDELGSLSALQQLDISYCPELECFPEHVLQGLTSLRSLHIWFCEKLKSLSEGVGHLTCLESLEILRCPELVSLPSNMNQLIALRRVMIKGSTLPEGLERIPSLQSLYVRGDHGLVSLPDWLGDITSLQELVIVGCTELRSLPNSFQHLTNLHTLYIEGSPNLEKRCERGTGEDWQNIATSHKSNSKDVHLQKIAHVVVTSFL
ncbi:putative disease resistance protein RGA3 [Gastrolobium bilobum]|uniref:putative disease resistance protein RGA3 n=1 Tax=Gastrolobium bilobum TaxID=150636 RepID=UPI002AB0A042|nr:putative disease resistance protein RGA3 [Gastrolobium bilobum]